MMVAFIHRTERDGVEKSRLTGPERSQSDTRAHTVGDYDQVLGLWAGFV